MSFSGKIKKQSVSSTPKHLQYRLVLLEEETFKRICYESNSKSIHLMAIQVYGGLEPIP